MIVLIAEHAGNCFVLDTIGNLDVRTYADCAWRIRCTV
jgi:hypothetical protein